MEERLTAREIAAYIELRKRIAEDEYRLKYVRSTAGDHSRLIEEIERELRECKPKLKIIEGKMESKGLRLTVPFQEKIEAISQAIGKLPPEEVEKAIRSKSGEIYAWLSERGKIVRRNVEARNEIAKLNIIMATAPQEARLCIMEAMRRGEPGERKAALPAELKEKVVKLLNRSGVHCSLAEDRLVKGADGWNESRVFVNNEYFWVPSEKLNAFTENEKLLAEVSVKLQVKNAELQVITFNEAQQNEFKALQAQYLDLLKARKEFIGAEEKDLELAI
ncbi:MAG: hypothetical protein QXH30_02305 [Candidatus Bilamarchaeaceae archaeon]